VVLWYGPSIHSIIFIQLNSQTQSAIKASNIKGKKEKKKPKKEKESVSFADGPPPGEGESDEEHRAKGALTNQNKPMEMTAEELADEEWGPSSKDKKSKKKKRQEICHEQRR